MKKRGVNEDTARGLVEDVTESIPMHTKSVVCGDWNARIGQLYPKIDETNIARKSLDDGVGPRAPWVIDICEIQGWYILNGI